MASIAETDDMVGVMLREGNSGCAVQAEHWIPKLVERIGKTAGTKVRVRFDAGFTGNPTLSALDDAKIEYVGRLSSNAVLEREAAHYLKRPVGRPTNELREWCYEFYYQAESWKESRRIILVVCEQPDNLFLKHFFLVTSLGWEDWKPHEYLICIAGAAKLRGI